MGQRLSKVTLCVEDYDEAIDYYTSKLGFVVVEDTRLSETKRWVVIAPDRSPGCHLLLAKATSSDQHKAVGNQTGGRVFLFLETDNFEQAYHNMKSKGVAFVEQPRDEDYGKVVVFEDLYGNLWDLVEKR